MHADDVRPVRRALLSVSDKAGLADFASALHAMGITILSTGGSARTIADAGIPVTEVAEVTGFPEILEGRVKTLHPSIHGGILARHDDPGHREQMDQHGITPIELVVVNLYPFEATLARGADRATCIENIDIGGPAMIRAAAKNHDSVAVVTNPADYEEVRIALEVHGGVPAPLRAELAARAFATTALYDAQIARWLDPDPLPEHYVLAGTRRERLRYGENPHQASAFYTTASQRPGVATASQIQGKALSYNNLNDTDAAYELVAEFDTPTAVIVKHANPCGVASAESPEEAFRLARAADPVSAFGGIIALNRPLDGPTAEALSDLFAEVVIAPEVTEAARTVLASRKALRVLEAGALPDPSAAEPMIRTLAGGFLVQDRDAGIVGKDDPVQLTQRTASAREAADLAFAWRVAKHVKSNAIVLAKDGRTVGVGAGQMSRVDSVRIAVDKARTFAIEAGETADARLAGAVMASDAFFPFPDGVEVAAEAGVTAVIHPGGSKRDDEVTQAADRLGLAMLATGMRHFRH